MEWSLTYILSQFFTIIMYLLLAWTYFLKNRKTILIVNFVAVIANALEYLFISAWSGFAMCVFALLRNVCFILDEKRDSKNKNSKRKDIITLICFYIILAFFAILTYDGFLSLLSVFGTSLYTYSVWQKKTLVYKFCGIPVGIMWLLYNIYVMSIFGIVLEGALLIASVSGYILELKKNNKSKAQK